MQFGVVGKRLFLTLCLANDKVWPAEKLGGRLLREWERCHLAESSRPV